MRRIECYDPPASYLGDQPGDQRQVPAPKPHDHVVYPAHFLVGWRDYLGAQQGGQMHVRTLAGGSIWPCCPPAQVSRRIA